MNERLLTKEQWLDLMAYSEIGGSKFFKEQLMNFNKDDIIKSEQMADIIGGLDVDEFYDYDLPNGYHTWEVVKIVNDFEEEQKFLLKLTDLFD